MTSTYTSKHFEQNVVLLRNEVSRYIERGICIVDNAFTPPSVILSTNLVFSLCKEIAKAREAPFVSVVWFKDGKSASVNIPTTAKCKPLLSHVMVLGVPYKRGQFGMHPIAFDKQSSKVVVYYHGPKGIEALKSWLMMCETDNGLRYILGLPPKVTRSSTGT